eukprot:g41471.t1
MWSGSNILKKPEKQAGPTQTIRNGLHNGLPNELNLAQGNHGYTMWGLSTLQIILPLFSILLGTAYIIYRRHRRVVYVAVRPIGRTYPCALENLEISTNSPPTPVQPSPKHASNLQPDTPVSHCPRTCPACRTILGDTHEQMLQGQMCNVM